MNSLVWLRTDLRTLDNPALAAAMRDGPATAMFYLAPKQWQTHADSPGKVDFWLRNLAELSQSLGDMGVALRFIDAQTWADAPHRISKFCAEHQIESVHVSAEWGFNERLRDLAVAEVLEKEGISWTVHHGATLLDPGTVLTKSGGAYRVFTPFARACRDILRPALPPVERRQKSQTPQTKGENVPGEVKGYRAPQDSVRSAWPAGESEAEKRLHRFMADHIEDYETARDVPSLDGTSRISAYLAAGVISPRQCLHAALHANQGEIDTGNKGARTWMTEILWREFYLHLLAAHPDLSKHRPMQPHTDQVQWRDSDDDFEAWTQGRTGIPIVDGAMRQLLACGWMHNRLRMVTAMFLSKNLLIDWRRGEQWFMEHLVDGDLASNNGGWQWSASTGADAVPYFRVFNPVSQSKRFDPQGKFIKQWVPELAGVDPKRIHEPTSEVRAESNYPQAIVDLGSSRRRAIDAFSGIARHKR